MHEPHDALHECIMLQTPTPSIKSQVTFVMHFTVTSQIGLGLLLAGEKNWQIYKHIKMNQYNQFRIFIVIMQEYNKIVCLSIQWKSTN